MLFPITTRVSPNKLLTVRYSISQPGNGYDFVTSTGTASRELDFTSNRTTANLQIGITNDGREENNGIVRVTLLPDLNIDENGDPRSIEYTVSSINGGNVGEVFVTDNDPTPELTLVAPDGPTSEGIGSVTFTITSTVDLGQAFKVRYQPSEVDSGDFLSDGSGFQQVKIKKISPYKLLISTNLRRVVVMSHHSGFQLIMMMLVKSTGEVEVELLAGDSTTDSYTVKSGTETQKAKTIWDDDEPTISIANAPTVTESHTNQIRFPLTALVSPNGPIDIYYSVSIALQSPYQGTSDDIIADSDIGLNKMQTVDFSDGATSANLVIPIGNDEDEEGDIIVTVTLFAQPDTLSADAKKYTLPATNNPVMGEVVDDETLPEILIATDHTFISANSTLAFTVSLRPNSSGPITVPITASDDTNESLAITPNSLVVGRDGVMAQVDDSKQYNW